MTAIGPAFRPRNVAVAGRDLAIAWEDGHESYFPFDDLRSRCPCARCRSGKREEASRDPLRVVSGPRAGEIAIRELIPVGAYALQIVWSDGHDSGIWAYETLRHSCPCEGCRSASA